MHHMFVKTLQRLGNPLQRINATTNLVKTIDSSSLKVQARCLRIYREKTIRSMYWRGRSFDRVKYPESRRDEFQDWNYRSEIFAFSRRLKENLSEDTLRRLFAHKSYVEKLQKRQVEFELPELKIQSNDELITRGSQLLNQCVKPYLRYHLDRVPEDGIVAITNYLKSEPILADMAKWFGCNDIILSAEWPPSETTKANTVLALLAGIEHDLGLDRTRRFVIDMIISYLNDKDILDDVWIIPHPKEKLNLILRNSQLPVYEPRIMFQTGMRTLEPCHIVGLYVNQKLIGSSAGETLAIAEECAALDAFQRMFDLKECRRPFVYGEESEKIDYSAHEKERQCLEAWTFKLE